MIEFEVTYIDTDGDEHFMEFDANDIKEAKAWWISNYPDYAFVSIRNPKVKEYFF